MILRSRENSQTDAPTWRIVAIQSLPQIEMVIDQLIDQLKEAGFSTKDLFGVRLAVEEAIVNAIKHGHQGDTSKVVHVRYHLSSDGQLLIEVEDQGPGFVPEEVPDCCLLENLDKGSGRGLFLMRAYMTWVRYNERGTCVTLCKQRSRG